MGKVKAQAVRLDERTRLMNVVSQDTAQGLLQQMGRGVGTHNGTAALHIDGRADNIIHLDGTLAQAAIVQELTALILLNISNFKAAGTQKNHTMVRHLTAHFRIEGRTVQNDNTVLAAGDGAGNLISDAHGKDLGLTVIVLVAYKGGGGIVKSQIDTGPSKITQGFPGLPGAHLLLLHQPGKRRLIQGHILVGNHFNGQIDGEAIGIIQLESVSTGKLIFTLGFMFRKHLRENLHTAIDGTGKIFFLYLDHSGDIVGALPQVGIVGLVFMNDRLHHLIQERMVHTEELTVAGRTAKQPAQNIAPALIAGQNTVGDHKGGCTDVVGNDPQRNVHLHAEAVGCAGEFRHLIGDIHNGVHIKQAVHILADNSKPLQAHAGIDILLNKLRVVTVSVVIKLGENIVPDFHIPVTVTANGAAGLSTAVLFAPVIVDFGAGAAGTGAMLPEIVLLAEPEDSLGGDADFLIPDFKRLVVIFINAGVQAVFIQTNHLGQEFPAPGNSFPLKVIAKREVAQHLKIGAVAGGFADILNISRTDTLLAGAYPAAGRLHFTLEIGLHGGHAGVDQQQRRVILRDQRKAGEPEMALALKKRKEHLPQFVDTIRLGIHFGSTSI